MKGRRKVKTLDASKTPYRELADASKADGDLMITGCLGERYLGCGKRSGTLHITGTPGNALASYLDGGSVIVDGNAQDAVADTMNDGVVAIKGNAGDALGYAMRGGRVYVKGDAGYRAGVHMKAYGEKTGVLVIGGSAGSFLGEYLAGGTIIVLGLGSDNKSPLTGYFCGNGMYAGRIYLRTSAVPAGLANSLEARAVTDEEKESALKPILSDYAKTLGLDESKCLKGSFIAIEPREGRTKRLYAAV